jgi:sterol desaturase/sphingolipid hydroxylase (fatty acid hydroxylase superfamily)
MTEFQLFLLQFVLPFILACSFLEAFYYQLKSQFNWSAMLVSLCDLFARMVVQYIFPLSLATPLLFWAEAHALDLSLLTGWEAFCVLFIVQDFCYYWMHRASHRMRWFWCNHAVHHSSNELNLSAAYRLGIFGRQMGTLLFFVPLVFLGLSPQSVYEVVTLNLLYQFWLHATWIPSLGPLEYVLNTPQAHRIHHACNEEYIDGNYGGVLIVFDRLFGTYKKPQMGVSIRYGLTRPLVSKNPVVVQFAEWRALYQDLKGAKSLNSIIGFLIKPPGWKP